MKTECTFAFVYSGKRYWLPSYHQTNLYDFTCQVLNCKPNSTTVENTQYKRSPHGSTTIYIENNLDITTKGLLEQPRGQEDDTVNINPQMEIDLTNNNVFGWSVSFSDPLYERQLEASNTNEFYNPTVENSIKPSKFLTHIEMDTNCVKSIQDKHFHFPTEAMLKLMPFKILSRIRWNSVLAERLANNVDNCAEILGFNKDKKGKHITPSRQGIS